MNTQDIALHHGDAMLHIELTRPAKRNALTAAMYATMAEALARAEQDPAIRMVLFSGAGQSFCAGNDLADFISSAPQDENAPVQRFIRGLARAGKILIAAVQGHAVGIGTTLLLHCDFVLAEPDTRLQMPFVDLGLVPEAGSSLLVPALIGPRRAAELLLLGEPVGAEQALALGLVSRVVAAGQAVAQARALALRLAAKPPGALLASKALMRSPQRDLQARITEESVAFAARLGSEEVRGIVRAFFAARAARPAADAP